MTTHTNVADLNWTPTAAQDEFYADVVLDTYDTAENPASTKRLIHGPANVRYVQYQDGGITAFTTARG